MSAKSTPSNSLIAAVQEMLDVQEFRQHHWEGSFADYLDIVKQDPKVARTAYQRIYDMILSYGSETFIQFREELLHYRFFDDPMGKGADAVFGLDRQLMDLVQVFQSAARGYGTERRVLLLHGPVGSSKSTIVRLLKKGLQTYSTIEEGALYTLVWESPDGLMECPMHEEPLHLIPVASRTRVLAELNANNRSDYRIDIHGELCPACRYVYRSLMEQYQGDWTRVIEHVKVKRLILSEQDRVGIGTFQPKDEKNQDSTELTGDINYRKIAEYGSDSDPRAFNFDGELNIANRGIVEFVELLKLDVAFLYDLLTASQEHKIKPKKFAQTDIDEVIVGHSVAGETPIPFLADGQMQWATLADLYERFKDRAEAIQVLSVNLQTQVTEWTPVKALYRHLFDGEILQTSQKWGVVETTPNHSIYDRAFKPFYPEDLHEVLALRALPAHPGELQHLQLEVPGTIGSIVERAYTTQTQTGWSRIDKPRVATQMRTEYSTNDPQSLKDLLTVLVWYATEGHVNWHNGGVMISQADKAELERVQVAYQHITTARGSIDFGTQNDSAWRLYLGSEIVQKMLVNYCQEHSASKRLPDFVFNLPRPYLEHVFDELMKTDGSRLLTPRLENIASEAYRDQFFEYKTTSPMLAAQVATLVTMLGRDYSVYLWKRAEHQDAYRIRFTKGGGVRGGRHERFEARLHRRSASCEWVYDIECVGNHNFVCGVGNIVCHNTNEPEYRKLLANEYMEALRDRTVKIDVPYVTRFHDEVKIYERDFNNRSVLGKHIAPHTLELAAMWAILTRLEDPKHASLTLMQKLKLYDGRVLPGFTEDTVREIQAHTSHEGMQGISPRYIQDKLSNALVAHGAIGCLNPFVVIRELESGLKHHSLLTNEKDRERYALLLTEVRQEYDEIVKNEVQRAITADESAITRLAGNYIDHVKAYTLRQKVKNPFTGRDEEPDERLMRSIEKKIDIPDSRKDDFRREIMNYIGAFAIEGKKFEWNSNERLRKALELKLFEDQKDSIKLTSLVSSVIDAETQEKIDVVKTRLIKNYGYCDICATDVLNYVASIFARGDVKA